MKKSIIASVREIACLVVMTSVSCENEASGSQH